MASSRVLKGHGFDVVIEDASNCPVAWPGNFYVGFELATLEALQALFERFKRAGVELRTDLLTHESGLRFFCRVSGGVLIEINTREDAAQPDRAGLDLA